MYLLDQEKHHYHQYFLKSWMIDCFKALPEYCNEDSIPEWEAIDSILHDVQYLSQLIEDKVWIEAKKKEYNFDYYAS
jgi:hypothetical protein